MKLSNFAVLAVTLSVFGVSAQSNGSTNEQGKGKKTSERYLRNNGNGGNGNGNGPNSDGSCGPRNNPVCAGDITYQNPCLAEAQGEMDYTNGPCVDAGRGKPVHFYGTGAATAEEMGRFKDEGFNLVGQVEILDYGPQPQQGEEGEPGPNANAPGQLKKLTRVTPDGKKYVAKDHIRGAPFETPGSEIGDIPPTEPGYEPETHDGGRKLQIGTDTRSKIESTFVYPYWRLGEVDWSGEGGCSGSIVGTNKVLLAAHCVYDTYYNRWQVPSRFAPGRYRTSSGSTREPWGTWPVQYATITTLYVNSVPPAAGKMSATSDQIGADVAILTMGTNWAGNIGSYMGTLPIIAAPCSIHPDSTTTGYPGIKWNGEPFPDGEMWTSGVCPSWESGCASNRIIRNECDISPGQSGSAVYDNNRQVFGVVSAGSSSKSYFFGFDSAWRDMVLGW